MCLVLLRNPKLQSRSTRGPLGPKVEQAAARKTGQGKPDWRKKPDRLFILSGPTDPGMLAHPETVPGPLDRSAARPRRRRATELLSRSTPLGSPRGLIC